MSSAQPQTIVIRSMPTTTLTVVSQREQDILEDLYGDGGGGPRKRRRLTHLTPEEKLLRRKLKNRVAAQTARDRKKNVMTELEQKVAELERKNKELAMQNVALRAESGTLQQENEALRERLAQETRSSPVMTEKGLGSAVSTDLLQQGQTLPLSYLKNYAVSMLTLSLTLLLASSHPSNSQAPVSRQSNLKTCQDKPAPRLMTQQTKWWGPQQQSWNPSMN